MAKALLGHVGGPDPRMLSDMRRLRRRVRDLEAQLAWMQQEHDVLAAAAGRHAKAGAGDGDAGPQPGDAPYGPWSTKTTDPFVIKSRSERTGVVSRRQ